MLKIIQQLKQQNPSTFSFALAGMIALFFAVTGLALLGNGLIEQKQIAKQVGDLQISGRSIESIVVTNRLTCGEEAAFAEFEKSVNSFNQQWTDFKQQHNYSAKTIKEIDTVWQRINSNAKIILAKKKDMMTLRELFQDISISFKPMRKVNDELVKVLLSNNTNNKQMLFVTNLNVLLLKVEKQINFPFNGDENAVCVCDHFDREYEEVADILKGLWAGDPDEGIEKIDNVKAREIIEKQMTLYKKIHSHAHTILQMTPEIFQVREAQATISRDMQDLKAPLAKLNHHKLNTGLLGLTLCSWLCVFACGYGYLRALKTRYN